MATDLSQGEVAAFLSHFDRNMPGYARLRELIRALTDQSEVGNSIEIASDKGDDRRRNLELDWTLELGSDRRRGKLHCTFERRGKNWIVTALDPIDFFAPK